MTNLVLDNPKQDTLSATLSRSDPDWQLIPDIASSHWGTWLSVGLSVLGYSDPSFPPHNVRYETIITPIEDPEIDTSVEFYPGGHESPVPSDDARDALRAQGYVLRTDPPTGSRTTFPLSAEVSVQPLYDGQSLITGQFGEDFQFCEANLRGQGGYNETFDGQGNGPGTPLAAFTGDIPPVGPIWVKSRILSGDDLWSDWSPITSLEWPP